MLNLKKLSGEPLILYLHSETTELLTEQGLFYYCFLLEDYNEFSDEIISA